MRRSKSKPVNETYPDVALREFHVSRRARDRYQFDATLFSKSGNVVFANFHAARQFAQKMNDRRDLVNYPEQAVRAGQLNAMGLIDEILHQIVALYQEQRNPQAMSKALAHLDEALGEEAVDKTLRAFADAFPPIAIYRQEETLEAYLAGETKGVSHRAVVLEELLMLWIANDNPGFTPFQELFDDSDLAKQTAYPKLIAELAGFFDTEPPFGPDNEDLVTLLRAPGRNAPHSLEDQLDFIRTRWSTLLGRYLYRLLSSLDFLAEEEKLFFGFGPGPESLKAYEFAGEDQEIEAFSPDSAWMPKLVLIAKNAYVWLDQLSKEYKQDIYRLDQVPDEELDKLGQWGITGLWLIGLWERSKASKRIKQIMGNPEAVASAYSLMGYRIADDLGGEEAYNRLKERAWQRGIRMASDMVPNHMGIDSRWVIEHPDWFVQLPYSPFPGYTFSGEDLCEDGRVGVYLEDHYFTRSDAAVVFKRVDHWTGDTRYIYHGNDGTSMPWNDTAQLNYLMPEVREAVIQTILAVARRSPIIRFDAAMTLAKKHFQRLWFPEPGTGGDIASRAEFGMTKADFDAAMPEEFWREVVDRVAAEAPDTLLLAEAFWLMEGYFVRTLGMHRVYNSAFMNMLRDEKNAEYRQLIKNTLEFDPQILKRYVNFMNNPDERTAVDQFGKGDKYFGICTLMATLPGLPMFGHGQVEGYTEKYGMEYRKAYWDERPDPWLVQRHERQVFPIVHKRYLFAEVDDYLLYDFYTAGGSVDENVFAYSNRAGHDRSLVLYHNRYAETSGWIHTSAAFAVKEASGDKRLEQRTLSEGLAIPDDPGLFLIFRDAVTGLEYLRNCHDLVQNGLYATLHAYQVQVFVDFREMRDNEWGQYAQLNAYLAGRGVPSIDEAMKELFLAPVHNPLRMLISAPAFRWMMDARHGAPDSVTTLQVLDQVETKMVELLKAVENATQGEGDIEVIAAEVRQKLALVLTLPGLGNRDALPSEIASFITSGMDQDDPATWGTLLGWVFLHALGKVVDEAAYAEYSRSWIDEWLLGKLFAHALQDLGLEEGSAWRAVATIKLMLSYRDWLADGDPQAERAYTILTKALREREVQAYLNVNRYQGVLWFNKESFEQLAWWMMVLATIELAADDGPNFVKAIAGVYALVETLLEAAAASEYQVAKLVEATKRAL
ncbi:MAG: alpha-amylase [Anaerolineae bacterium]|nr:alpha-amylase [Anaerolineae bacterium]